MSRRNIALQVEYDGTDFVGSQWQNNGRSVQGELEGAWEQLTQERCRATLAGRTDAGVHARGQIANFLSETQRDLHTIRRGLNAILPEDVAVPQVWAVDADFHARHSAVRRSYRYLIDNGRVPSALLRRQAAYVASKLNAEAMHEAAQALVGRHDFGPFTDGPQEGSTERTCVSVQCTRTQLWDQPLIAVDIAANAFLRHMVRKIVGLLLLVGDGREDIGSVARALQGERRRSGPLAPAHGLYLMKVVYPGGRLPATPESD
jgi:tRNA pseudouridine38-40 synthase